MSRALTIQAAQAAWDHYRMHAHALFPDATQRQRAGVLAARLGDLLTLLGEADRTPETPWSVVYRHGDASTPPERPVVLVHIVNDEGRWGAGYTQSLDRRSGRPSQMYRAWASPSATSPTWPPFQLGEVLLHPIDDGVCVAHLLAQHGVGRGRRRVDYTALGRALQTLASLHGPLVAYAMPRIGTGLGGGDWAVIESLLACLAPNPVYVYVPSAP